MTLQFAMWGMQRQCRPPAACPLPDRAQLASRAGLRARCRGSCPSAVQGTQPATTTASSTLEDRASRRLHAALQLYEQVWSTGRIRDLDKIMAEDHVQRDMIWQPDRVDGGRDRMKRGVLAFRKAYPDLKFNVQHAASAPGGEQVFVLWHARGTNLGALHEQAPSGESVDFQGVSMLRFNEQDQIQESLVFRQAPRDEFSHFAGAKATAAPGSPTRPEAAGP